MIPNRFSAVAFLAGLTITLGACDPQVDSTFQGDPLATIQGWVLMQEPLDLQNPLVCLVWFNFASSPDSGQTDNTPIEGGFPATFRVDIMDVPPASVLNDFTHGGREPSESRVGVGFILVYDDLNQSQDMDCNAQDEPEVCPDRLLGTSLEYAVVFVEEDVNPGTFSEEFLGASLPAGFHLMDVVTTLDDLTRQCHDECRTEYCPNGEEDPSCDRPGLLDCLDVCGDGMAHLQPAPQGFASEVSITLVSDWDQLNIPDIF